MAKVNLHHFTRLHGITVLCIGSVSLTWITLSEFERREHIVIPRPFYALGSILCMVLFCAVNVWSREWFYRRRARQNGAQLPPQWKAEWFGGIDLTVKLIKAGKEAYPGTCSTVHKHLSSQMSAECAISSCRRPYLPSVASH